MSDLYKGEREPIEDEPYYNLFKHAPVAYFIADPETGEIVECNARAETLIGRTRDQIIGMHQSQLHPKGEEEKYKKIFAQNVEQTAAGEFEAEVQHSDDRRIPVRISHQNVELRGKKMIVGIFIDMTEQRRLEAHAESLDHQIEFVLRATKTGLDIIDSGYNVKYVDPFWKEIYGEPAGKKCYEYFMGAKRPCPDCGITRALATKQPVVTEQVLPKENNRPIEITTIPFQDENGEWLVAEVNVDITERKKADELARDSERRFRQLTESLPQLVWTCLPEGPCDYLSRQWIEYTGIPEAEQLGYGWIQQLHPDDRKRVITAWDKAVKKGVKFDIEFRIRNSDGAYRWFKTRAIPVCDADGMVVKWFGSNTDIDDLKRAEEALRDSEEKLRVQKEALEQKNIAIREIMEQIGAEKFRIREDILSNVDKVLLPTLRKLRAKASRIERRHISVLESSIKGLASSFGRAMSEVIGKLTPREVEICSMIRRRLTNKEMAKMLHISRRSVETHRHNIRKKLGLANRKVNLTSYLQIH